MRVVGVGGGGFWSPLPPLGPAALPAGEVQVSIVATDAASDGWGGVAARSHGVGGGQVRAIKGGLLI